MNPHVLILGGGVAGMSAAHELIERGFTVTVLERAPKPGGKARTLGAPSPLSGGRKALPGEHGFRFFPHFYQHLHHSMRRIPLAAGGSVYDNLVRGPQAMLAREGQPPIVMPTSLSGSLLDPVAILKELFSGANTGLHTSDFLYFGQKVWKLMTSCRDRALDEFESTSWWDFMDASNQSPAFRTYLVEGLTRCLVAAKAREANVRAGGVVLTQLFYGLFSGETIDWVLNGPTDEAWLDPWKSYLDQAGVKFVMDAEVTAIALVNDRVSEVAFRQGGRMQTATADYCVGALPVEVMQALWSPQMRALNPQFAMNLDWLATQVDWMTGIQYFMPARIDLTQGHVTFIDSPWALTAISQPQFWPQVDLTQYGDGTLPGIISIDISEWEHAGSTGKSAKQCTADEIADEVWHQMVERLNVGGAATLPVATPPHRLLDPNIEFGPLPVRNNAQLFINKVHSWPKRPTVRTPIRNFYLASDYLQTETNLATMEAANEAARSAVQTIIDASGVAATPCKTWRLPDPYEFFLKPYRELDQFLYDSGSREVPPYPFVH